MDILNKPVGASYLSCLARNSVEFIGKLDGDQPPEEFDRVSSKDQNLIKAMTICLDSMGVNHSSDPWDVLIRVCEEAAKIHPDLHKCFDDYILSRTKWDHSINSSDDDIPEMTEEDFFADMEAIDEVYGGDRVCTRLELISKTGAFPIDSNETLTLVALTACLPDGDSPEDVARDYFKALTLYISRRHNLQARLQYSKNANQLEASVKINIAKDIVMIWLFYRHCRATVVQGKIRAKVHPDDFISLLYPTRPLFVLSDTEYITRLDKCKSEDSIMQCFRVYGNGVADRKDMCREAFHRCKQVSCGSKYSKYSTDKKFDEKLSSKNEITRVRIALDSFTLETDKFHPRFQLQLNKMAILSSEKEGLIAHLTPDESYEDRYVRELPMDRPFIGLRAACGTGKSVEMLKYIGRLDEDTVIVIITHRKALSAELSNRTKKIEGRAAFKVYNEIEGKIDLNHHRNVICEYESLSRVLPYSGKFCVIIDEVNSVLFQTLSKVGDVQGAHAVFTNLMNFAFRVLVMDAFLDQDRIDVLKRYVKTKPYVIENKCKPNSDHKIWHTTNKNVAKQRLLSLIEEGENVVVPCIMKADAEEIYHLVCDKLDKNEVFLFTADNRWENGDDINEVWSKARVVIHTSTMDSGHSFERDHFGWCVCFFSNRVQIPVEGCLQMKARSRLTKRFIICIEQIPPSKEMTLSSVEDYIAHVQKNERALAETSCRNHYGEIGYWLECEKKGGYPVCPFLFLYASLNMLTQRSARHYKVILFLLLREDGVSKDNFYKLDGDGSEIKMATKKAREEAKKHAKIPSPQVLASIYKDTRIEVFESMTEDQRRFYSDKKVIQAYQNTRALKMEGIDFCNAIQNAKEKQKQLLKLTDLCRYLGEFTKDSILQTELQLGIHSEYTGQNESSFLQSVLIGSELSKMFTGDGNPFCTTTIDASQLRNNLQSSCRNPEENSDSRYTSYEIKPDWSRRITDLCNQYHLISGNERQYPVRAKSSLLTVTEALTLANKVFKLQFGLELKRTSRRKTTKDKNQEYIYEMQDLFHAEQGSEIQVLKPTMKPWSSGTRDDELLCHKTVDGMKIVCLGPAFDHWPVSVQRFGYIPIGLECLESKKRKLEADRISDLNSKIKMKKARKLVTQTSKASAESSLLESYLVKCSSSENLPVNTQAEAGDREHATRIKTKRRKRRRMRNTATQESREWMDKQKASVVCNSEGNAMGWNVSQYWSGQKK